MALGFCLGLTGCTAMPRCGRERRREDGWLFTCLLEKWQSFFYPLYPSRFVDTNQLCRQMHFKALCPSCHHKGSELPAGGILLFIYYCTYLGLPAISVPHGSSVSSAFTCSVASALLLLHCWPQAIFPPSLPLCTCILLLFVSLLNVGELFRKKYF